MFKMWWLSKGLCLGVLMVLSGIDIRYHKVPVKALIISNIMAFNYYIVYKEINIFLFAGGIGVGFIFLFISRATREGVGYGDSWAILILGSFLGIWDLLMVLFIAFFFLAIFAVIILNVRKMSRTYAIPFFPFLTGGYMVTLLTEGGIL